MADETIADNPPRPGLLTIGGVAAFYVACLAVATYPLARSFGSGVVGSLLDPMQHLWIMKWYRTCLLEGRWPTVSPEIMAPVGAPLGNFSPLHLQAILFIPLSLALGNDFLAFNLVWLAGMLTTGLGAFALAWHVVRDRRCATVAGLLAMLSGPMMLHARAHLELIFVGTVPLFLVGWLRFVDVPTRRRLFAAVGLYLLVALSAAYYAVFATIPAVLYVAWKLAREGRGAWTWLRARLAPLLGFGALAAAGLAVVFYNQIWSMRHGYSIARPMSEFNGYGTAVWTYFIPTVLHRFSLFLPVNFHEAAGFGWSVGEKASYLGVATLALAYYAAVWRVKFPRAGFWWATLALLVALSIGATWQFGSHKLPMPAGWLKRNVAIFRLIRVPARFNLFAAVAAAVVAAAGLKDLLARIRVAPARVALLSGLVALTLVDLGTPLDAPRPPKMPGAYAFVRAQDPKAAFVEVPQFTSSGSHLHAMAGYWQTIHRGRTTAGYAGHGNVIFDNLLTWNSPFLFANLANANFPASGDGEDAFDITNRSHFDDYAWLYLHAHGFRYVILHQWPGATADEPAVSVDRLKARLESAKVFEDDASIVYDRERLASPSHAVLMTMQGWRTAWHGRRNRVMEREGRMLVFNPTSDKPVRFAFDAMATRQTRTVRLMAGPTELARWEVEPKRYFLHATGPIRLPAGLQELRLVCEGEDKPASPRQNAMEWDSGPYSLRVNAIALIESDEPPAEPPAAVASEVRTRE